MNIFEHPALGLSWRFILDWFSANLEDFLAVWKQLWAVVPVLLPDHPFQRFFLALFFVDILSYFRAVHAGILCTSALFGLYSKLISSFLVGSIVRRAINLSSLDYPTYSRVSPICKGSLQC